MSAKQTKGRSTKSGRWKKGAKTGYKGNKNASKPASQRKWPKKKKKNSGKKHKKKR